MNPLEPSPHEPSASTTSLLEYPPTVHEPTIPSSTLPASASQDAEDEDRDTIEDFSASTLPAGVSSSTAVAPDANPQVFEDAVEEFFHGTPALEELRHSAARDTLTLTRANTRMSTASTTTFLAARDTLHTSLESLCQLLDAHPSLRDAEIVSSESYTEPMYRGLLPGLVHRFLLLELRRGQRKTIWLRLERWRDKSGTLPSFLFAGLKTGACDTVRFATSAKDLIGRGRPENQQIFRVVPRLGQLHHLMHVIGYELTSYELLSRNCWFFVSLLQQHLGLIGQGQMARGKLPTPNIDQQIRDTIAKQVAVQREFERAASSPAGIQTPQQTIGLLDLEKYARYALRLAHGLEPSDIARLSDRSQGSFACLVIACSYVGQRDSADLRSRDRLQLVLDGGQGLDALYTTILEARGNVNSKGRVVRQQFLKLMLSAKDKLPVGVLLELLPPEFFPPNIDILSEVQHLWPILRGVDKDGALAKTPVAPYHSSFVEFIGDPRRSRQFYIDPVAESWKLHTLYNASNSIFDPNYILPDALAPTPSDIELSVHQALRSLGPSCTADRTLLARKAEGSLKWAMEACRVVMTPAGVGHDSRVRLRMIAEYGLDGYYTSVIQARSTGDGLAARLRLLNLMLSVRESMPLDGLLQLLPEYFVLDADILSELQPLSPVLRGVSGDDIRMQTPVTPYHSSFLEFLGGIGRTGQLHIDQAEPARFRIICDAAYSVFNPDHIYPEITTPTAHDIELLVHYALRSLGSSSTADRALLAHRAEGSLKWAVEACREIMIPAGTSHDSRIRLHLILSESLDEFYETALKTHTDDEHPKASRTLINLLCDLPSSPLSSILEFADAPKYFLVETGQSSKGLAMEALRLALNQSGCRRSSFWGVMSPQCTAQFNLDMPRIDTAHLAEYCLSVMMNGLCFNIANLPTSFLRNQDVLDLKQRVEANITPLLSYCCRFWPLYASTALKGGANVPSLVAFLENCQLILQWMEVMSLIRSSPENALGPLAEITTAPPAISTFIANIMHFSKMFATPIAISTPHIYISALAFAPKCSMFSSQTRSDPGTARHVRGLLTEWPCCLQILEGHSNWVRSVVFSPDGARVASGSDDGTVRLWDPRTGAAITEPMVGHSGRVLSVAFSPDGMCIASGSTNGTIRLWDIRTGTALRDLLVENLSWVRSVAFSPDGAEIASGCNDGKVRLWDARSGVALMEPLVEHTGGVLSVAFSADGTEIVSGSHDTTICLWDTKSGGALGEPLVGHSGGVLSVAFSPDGSLIASGSHDKTVRLWDAETGDEIGEPLVTHSKAVWSVAFSPDGAQIASSYSNQTVCLWDTQTGAAIGEPMAGHSGDILSVAFSPDGTRVASGSCDGTVRLWDIASAAKEGSHRRGEAEEAPHGSEPPNQPISGSSGPDEVVTMVEDELNKCSPQRSSTGAIILREGWIVGPNDELLLWVPPAHRERLGGKASRGAPDEHSFTIEPTITLDFGSSRCGEYWARILNPDAQST